MTKKLICVSAARLVELEGAVIRGHGEKINSTLRVGRSAADVAAASKLGDEIGGCDFIARGRVSSHHIDSFCVSCSLHLPPQRD